MIRFLNDSALVEAIRNGGPEREAALRTLYGDGELKAKSIAYVRNNNGNAEDGQDVWQEAIIALDRSIRQGKFREDAPVRGYLFSICRFVWMNQLRKKAHTTLVEELPTTSTPDPDTPELAMMEAERKSLLNQLLEQLGDRCRKILELWKLSYSMEEIAEKLGFSSEAMARKAKYRCQQSLMELVQQSPDLKELLK